jgi:predicted Ser/Thr protein kinase
MGFSPGENVGPYRVVEQLGQGGMASVFKAYHAALDRYVALKVLHPAFLEDPNFLARFQREAKVVARLDHPNIVPIYDFAEHEGQPYLVMKYIQGRTLKAELAQGSLSGEQKLNIISAVGKALSYAHDQGVLHRDIKPSNVLLSDDGGIYLADFGLARIAQAGQSTLSSDMLLGTPQYISPEQARGEEELDEGTDIYSFAVVIYEMVVGRVPFNADTPFSIIHDHIYTPLPMPRQVNPSVPEKVERVLLKALAKDRDDRFATVAELVQAFHGAAVNKQDTVPLEAVPETALGSAAEAPPLQTAEVATSNRRRWLWAVAGIVLTCLCLFAFLTIANRLQDQNEAEAGTATALVFAGDELPAATAPATEVIDDPRVVELRQAVSNEPDNPELHLELGQALVEAGYPRIGSRQWIQAAELYMEGGAYLEAADAFVQVINLAGGPGLVEAPVREAATEALYKTATSPRQALPLIARIQDEYPDWTAILPIRARAALYNGNLAEALSELERAQGQNQDPMLAAVLAEAYVLDGQPARAAELAQEVLENSRTAPWLRAMTEELMIQLEIE